MFVLVLDEVDRLLAKGTEDLSKLFMLPQTPGDRLGRLDCVKDLELPWPMNC
jgi:Cdc6-like AAA superfamily ATPase